MLTTAEIIQFMPPKLPEYHPQPHAHIERAAAALLVLASKARKGDVSTADMLRVIDTQILRLQHLKIEIKETLL